MICKHCGATIPENSKFCLTCGKEVCKESSAAAAGSAFMKAGSLDVSTPSKPITPVSTETKERKPASELHFSSGFNRSENTYVEVKEEKPNPLPNPKGVFCGYCGAKNREDAAFCEECGAPLDNSTHVASRSNPVKEKPEAHKRNRIVGISIVAVIVAACIAIVVGIFGGRSYKSTADKFIKATFEADGKAMLSLIPEKMIKAACDEADMTERELAKEITQSLEDTVDYYNRHYDEWSYSYEIAEVKDISGEDLKDIKENYKDEFGVKVKAAKTVTVEVIITLDGDTMKNKASIQMIKVGNSWYLDAPSMGGLF